MGVLDYVIIAAVLVWFAAALRSIIKKRGGCSCGAGGGTKTCSGCAGCGAAKACSSAENRIKPCGSSAKGKKNRGARRRSCDRGE